jgi:hypothetical protein
VLSGGVGLASFILIGLGAANIVPILFRLAGPQQAMPKGLAALTTDVTSEAST